MLVYGYFFSCGGWNQNARLDSIFAFVEPGTEDFLTFHIDRFIVNPEKGYNTGDWSFYKGHYYSNKAPGTTFIGIPVYASIFGIEKLFGLSYNHPYIEILNAYLINFFLSVVIVSVAILYFYKLLLLRGASLQKSLCLAMILAFSTCVFPFSTELWGHTIAMSFIIFALYNIEQESTSNYLLAGLFCGVATLTDYLALFPTITIGLYLVYTRYRCLNNRNIKLENRIHRAEKDISNKKELVYNCKKVFYFIIGGIGPMLIMLGYHYICFGNILNTSTTFTNPIFLEDNKLLGIFGAFSSTIFLRLLFSLERGLLIAMPVLVFAIPGFLYLLKKDIKSRDFAIFSFITIVVMLIVNSSFNGWHGGNAACARYQIVTLPFWILLIGGIPYQKVWKIVMLMFACLSAFNMLALVSVCVQLGADWNPIYKTAYTNFFRGNFNISNYPIRLQAFNPDWAKFAEYTSFNIGKLLGLNEITTLLPLFIVIILAILMLRHIIIEIETKNSYK
jgi:hypothetical protein